MKHSSHEFMKEKNHSLDRVTIFLDKYFLPIFQKSNYV